MTMGVEGEDSMIPGTTYQPGLLQIKRGEREGRGKKGHQHTKQTKNTHP
jgi:hypothetical protein